MGNNNIVLFDLPVANGPLVIRARRSNRYRVCPEVLGICYRWAERPWSVRRRQRHASELCSGSCFLSEAAALITASMAVVCFYGICAVTISPANDILNKV